MHKCVLAGDITVSCIGSKDNITDIFTKPLACSDFHCLRHYLGIWVPGSAWGGLFSLALPFWHLLHLLLTFPSSCFSCFLVRHFPFILQFHYLMFHFIYHCVSVEEECKDEVMGHASVQWTHMRRDYICVVLPEHMSLVFTLYSYWGHSGILILVVYSLLILRTFWYLYFRLSVYESPLTAHRKGPVEADQKEWPGGCTHEARYICTRGGSDGGFTDPKVHTQSPQQSQIGQCQSGMCGGHGWQSRGDGPSDYFDYCALIVTIFCCNPT